ncbi:mucin-5AC [Hyalella azteca]|uniref:Mucin-5AC n=1 Tax=Hyalella azteca TaxID=294128 RepID=A0A8B7PD47_HYAAZ|nr:mucin-5AC [Hyalella azteca]
MCNTQLRLLLLLSVAMFASHAESTELCPRITIENGRVKMRSRNRVAKFRCRRNFLMIEGDRFVTCSLGTWRGTVPKCVGSGCNGEFSITNGRFLLLFGEALAQFECDHGYQLVGSSALSCNGRRWNASEPTCEAPQHTLYDCNFEESNCGWTSEATRDMRWTRTQGRPYAQWVGKRPSIDHTYNNISGHYMYVDTSVNGDWKDVARLYSPVLQPFVISPTCATLWVYKPMNDTGELNIYAKPESEDLDILAPEVSITDEAWADWHLVYISLQDIDEPFQIVVEAVWGDGYMSDVAIDDFLATYGMNCIDLEVEFKRQSKTEAHNVSNPDSSWLPIPTQTSQNVITSGPAPTSTTLEQRTLSSTTTTQKPTTSSLSTPVNAVTPPNPTTTTTTTTTTTSSVKPTTPSTTVKASTSTTTRSSTIITTTSKKPFTAITIKPTDKSTTKQSITKSTTSKPTTKSTTSKPTTKSTTQKPTTKSTSQRLTTTKVAVTKTSTQAPPADLPVSDEVKSPEQEKQFSVFLSILLISLGIVFIVALLIFMYKKCDTLRQLKFSEDSDVKYLQQGDDESNGFGDSDSLVYHPRSRSVPSGSNYSSPSTSSASSMHSDIGDCANLVRKPIRPPPPVPLAAAAASRRPAIEDISSEADICDPRSSPLSSSLISWAESSQMTEVPLMQATDTPTSSTNSPSLGGAGNVGVTEGAYNIGSTQRGAHNLLGSQSDTHNNGSSSVNYSPYSSPTLPPPVPPRSHGGGTAI